MIVFDVGCNLIAPCSIRAQRTSSIHVGWYQFGCNRIAPYDRHESAMMELTAVLTPAEEGGFVALNPETGTTTQGESIEEALANLREATALYREEFAA